MSVRGFFSHLQRTPKLLQSEISELKVEQLDKTKWLASETPDVQESVWSQGHGIPGPQKRSGNSLPEDIWTQNWLSVIFWNCFQFIPLLWFKWVTLATLWEATQQQNYCSHQPSLRQKLWCGQGFAQSCNVWASLTFGIHWPVVFVIYLIHTDR